MGTSHLQIKYRQKTSPCTPVTKMHEKNCFFSLFSCSFAKTYLAHKAAHFIPNHLRVNPEAKKNRRILLFPLKSSNLPLIKRVSPHNHPQKPSFKGVPPNIFLPALHYFQFYHIVFLHPPAHLKLDDAPPAQSHPQSPA